MFFVETSQINSCSKDVKVGFFKSVCRIQISARFCLLACLYFGDLMVVPKTDTEAEQWTLGKGFLEGVELFCFGYIDDLSFSIG